MLANTVVGGDASRRAGIIIALALLCYALAFVTYWHYLFIFDQRFDQFYRYQRDLLSGHTEWIADQNRVLAPILILFAQKIFILRYEKAYQNFMWVAFVVQNICTAMLFWRCRLSLSQSIFGLLLVSMTPLSLMSLWWFPWTNLEFILVLLTFLLDASSIRPTMRVVLYTGLFAAWSLTKETSFFLAIWIALRYGLPAISERRWAALVRLALLCAGMVLVSAGVVSGLRHWLWVSGSNPNNPSGMPNDIPTVLGGTHLYSMNPANTKMVIRNYRAFLTLRSAWPLWNNKHFLDWSVGMIDMLVALVISACFTVWAFAQRSLRLLALALMALIYVALLFLITNTAEADKLMPVLAMGAYAYALLAKHGSNLQALSDASRIAMTH